MKFGELLKQLNALAEYNPSLLKSDTVIQTSPIRAKDRSPFYVKAFTKGFFGSGTVEVCFIPVGQEEHTLCPYCGTKLRSASRTVCKNCRRNKNEASS